MYESEPPTLPLYYGSTEVAALLGVQVALVYGLVRLVRRS